MRCRLYIIITLACLAGLGAAAAPAAAQQGATGGEWHSYAADAGSTKYSPLEQIDRDNFGDLEVAWRWQSADAYVGTTTDGGGQWWSSLPNIVEYLEAQNPNLYRRRNSPRISSMQATPLMVDGVLYLNTALSQGVAVEARTGETLWVHNPKSYEEGTTTMTVTWRQRGVAYWTDGTDQRIFWGTGNGYLICAEAKTGLPCAGFGDGGRVDLTVGLPRARSGTSATISTPCSTPSSRRRWWCATSSSTARRSPTAGS